METRTVAETGSGLALTALIVAVLALILAWVAFNRASDTTVTEEVRQETREAVEDMRIYAARVRAETRLAAVRNDAELREDRAAYEAEVRDIRTPLEEAYANASEETREEWNELQAQFDQLEDEIRAGTSNSLETLQGLIGKLQAEVQIDN